MKKFIALIILLSFATQVRAGLVTDFDPVEQPLLEKQRLEDEMSRDFKKQQQLEQARSVKTEEKKQEGTSGSTWWKWALGILVVGGVAAAAGGGGGGGGTSSGTGSVTATW